MKDFNGVIRYKDRDYKLVFNLNVMEAIQSEYGSVDKWAELTDAKGASEPDAKAIIFGITEMVNEGIDIDNEDNGTDIKPMTLKQVGRMITDYGLREATMVMNTTVIESVNDNSKNG